MRFFRNTSIRQKQTLVIMLTSSIVLFLACAAFVTYDTVTFRRKLVESISILAEAIGNNCAAALDFNDPRTAAETLSALRANDNFVFACVYDRDGALFALYQRYQDTAFVPPSRPAVAELFSGDQLHLARSIEQKGEVTGTIFVVSDLRELSARRIRYLGIVGGVFLASLILALGLSSRLQRLVSDPILRLAQVTRAVALEKNYSVRASKQSNDELGELVDGFNEMLAQIQARDIALDNARIERERRAQERTQELEIIHQQLVEASRRGGMAEIATNVLHNVGNVLNSINISAGLIVENVKQSKASRLPRLVALLRAHEHDLATFISSDARGKHVLTYLAELSELLSAEQREVVSELDSLQTNVGHINEIVAMQQSYASFGGVTEMINVATLIEDSLRMTEDNLVRHQVEVVRDFAPVPDMSVQKHKILQILVNLLRNASYACQESGRSPKRITVRLVRDGGWIRIAVIDTGIGIPPENLTRIFNHGFTTRPDGHGFGLHSGALAAKEIGGALIVHSDGLGQGAAFTLSLPCPVDEMTLERRAQS